MDPSYSLTSYTSLFYVIYLEGKEKSVNRMLFNI